MTPLALQPVQVAGGRAAAPGSRRSPPPPGQSAPPPAKSAARQPPPAGRPEATRRSTARSAPSPSPAPSLRGEYSPARGYPLQRTPSWCRNAGQNSAWRASFPSSAPKGVFQILLPHHGALLQVDRRRVEPGLQPAGVLAQVLLGGGDDFPLLPGRDGLEGGNQSCSPPGLSPPQRQCMGAAGRRCQSPRSGSGNSGPESHSPGFPASGRCAPPPPCRTGFHGFSPRFFKKLLRWMGRIPWAWMAS